MSQALTPKEIARAAAQGVAIALNARKGASGAPKKEEALFVQRPIICGIPPVVFEVAFNANPAGELSPGEPTATRE